MFEKILIANRGEIAVRVIRACRELGVSPVAVYSDPDRLAPHVLLADEAIRIGPAAPGSGYLDGAALIQAALDSGAGAIHPGYGFLAENAEFARRVEESGLAFIGPPAGAMAEMGDKTAARSRMRSAGIPIIPGSDGPVGDAGAAEREAEAIGFPVLLKAAAGGGGKGMRLVEEAKQLERALEAARREALQAFGDARVYVEKHLPDPRHIEFQIVADGEGSTIHLGERECSIQRRHQKLVEEAPSPAVGQELRARMGAVAVEAARAVGYVGAGTVEFLVQEGEFYFLEMNTRIQVEHPVTELVTGVDLVQLQVHIAAGEPVDLAVDPRWPRGHAIECRISAEDPSRSFLPASGRIRSLHIPGGPGVRWDGGIVEGTEVDLHYDPLLGKLIVHAPSRPEAIARMRRALEELLIEGVRTTQPFHLAVMEEADFRRGEVSIRYLAKHEDLLGDGAAARHQMMAAVAAVLSEHRARSRGFDTGPPVPPLVPEWRPEGRSDWQRAFDEE